MTEIRTIVIVCRNGNDFDVSENSVGVEHLTWDEMLGQVACLTHPKIAEARYRKRTPTDANEVLVRNGSVE